MKRNFLLLLNWIVLTLSVRGAIPEPLLPDIVRQVRQQVEIYGTRFPEYTVEGKWLLRDQPNWLSGFLGGELWLLYEMTQMEDLKDLALRQADRLLAYAGLDNTHDMGFIFLPTCVKAWQMTGDTKYRAAALQAAEMLARRFQQKGRFIRAWGRLGTSDRAGWMIIDTMMNLELLFWAARATNDVRYYDIAYGHALTTLRQAVRPDGSTYHVVEFDTLSGNPLRKFTHQGAGDESTWARGQAWGVYGFTQAYLATGDERFLKVAEHLADFFLAHLPADQIPPYDLTDSTALTVRDASAAAILVCGLEMLAEAEPHELSARRYQQAADSILDQLIATCLFNTSQRPAEQGLLLHTVYHFHKKWGIDASFPAGDYYLVEALYRRYQAQRRQNLIQGALPRQQINLNRDWYYSATNVARVNDLSLVQSDWQKVQLPHTWNAFDAVDNVPGYRRDAGWYKKQLFIPSSATGQRLLLCFEGVNLVSEVYVNGCPVGGHSGGYIGFEIDITPAIRYDGWNEVLVRVDNAINPELIPSQKADFIIYGGITRDVWLKVLPPTYLQRLLVTTPAVSAEKAQTEVRVNISNAELRSRSLTLELLVRDLKGKVVLRVARNVPVSASETTTTVSLPVVAKPRLWSPADPVLYTAVAILKDKETVIDSLAERFGYRWFEFKPHGPFYLNGARLLLRGTHRHEDWAGLGNALPDSLHRRDLQMIKAMGANFVRLAHYPQDPAVYQACDELGLLVWDELPWCRGGLGNAQWKQNTRRALSEMITQNFNHPSIMIWSLGNEQDWLPDFADGDNADSMRAFLTELNQLARRQDPRRLTAVRKFYGNEDIVDVFSPSIWSGWYSGVYQNYGTVIEEARQKYRGFVHMEYGGDSHVGRHTENPISGSGIATLPGDAESTTQIKIKNIAQSGDWSESYIVDLFDWYLHLSENSDWLSGNAQWAFKDFPTPLRPENPIPYINQKGLLDRAGNPKDAYYVFKSYWTTSPAFCYIESPTWTERRAKPDETCAVSVFSNCQAVELLVNGQALGVRQRDTQKFPVCGLQWDVRFQPGENLIIAVGQTAGGTSCSDTLTINFSTEKSGAPESIRLSAQRQPGGNYLVEALVVDGKGRRCLDYNRRIYFALNGAGRLRADYGTPTGSTVIEAANGRAAIEYLPVPGETGIIEARNQDFKGSYLKINIFGE